MKVCKNCKTEKQESDFALRKDTGKRRGVCIRCKWDRQNLLKLRARHEARESQPSRPRHPWEAQGDKLYISKYLNQWIAEAPVYKFCKWCRVEIKYDNVEKDFYEKGYCGEWCYEQDFPPDISHTCKTCGIVVSPHLRRDGNSSGMYPAYCEEHRRNYIRVKNY